MKRILKDKRALIDACITKDHVVLDVGFWGQATQHDSPRWPHNMLIRRAREVYGVDLEYDEHVLRDLSHYKKASAENFDFGEIQFDVIFGGDVIEHLSNPGLFLDCSKKALKKGGVLIISTPNCFNLWNLISKLMRYEPAVNNDHTCYFNEKTIRQLYLKNGWEVTEILYLYKLDTNYTESFKKKLQNGLYWLLSKFTTKFLEPMVVIAHVKQ